MTLHPVPLARQPARTPRFQHRPDSNGRRTGAEAHDIRETLRHRNRQSKIRFRGARDRDQIVIKVVDIVLGADRLEIWIA